MSKPIGTYLYPGFGGPVSWWKAWRARRRQRMCDRIARLWAECEAELLAEIGEGQRRGPDDGVWSVHDLSKAKPDEWTGLTYEEDLAQWGCSYWGASSPVALLAELRVSDYPIDRYWDHQGRVEGTWDGGPVPLFWSLPWVTVYLIGSETGS